MEIRAGDQVRCRSLAYLRQQVAETGKLVLPPGTIKAKIAIAENIGPVDLVDSITGEKYFIPEIEDKTHQDFIQEARDTALNSPCWAGKVGAVVVNDEGQIEHRNFNKPIIPGQECENLELPVGEARALLQKGEMLNFCQAVHDVGGLVDEAAREGFSVGYKNWYLSLEPCDFCANSLINTRAKNVYFTTGVADRKRYYNSEGLLRLAKSGIPTYYVRMEDRNGQKD
jgi:deoxycytidylate deaminase